MVCSPQQPIVDMFPHANEVDDINMDASSHVETVCLLIKQNLQVNHHVNVGLDAEDYYQLKTK